MERMIPIYLIVGGAVGIYMYSSELVLVICQQKVPGDKRTAFDWFCLFHVFLIRCLALAWFIAGEFCVSLIVIQKANLF